MFKNLEKLLREKHSDVSANKAFYIENGYYPTWAEQNRVNGDRGLKEYSTDTKWEAYQAGKITRDQAVAYAVKRMERAQEKDLAKELHRLETVYNAPELEGASIHVHWKRSATWGYNPTATVYSNTGETEGRASGCGYDKCSAAVAGALNANLSALRALYVVAEQALAEGKRPTAPNNASCVSWRDILGYGSGYGVLPYFEGGVGVSCFASILEKCGFKWCSYRGAKHYDLFTIERKE